MAKSDLLLLLAEIAPEETLLDMVEEAITQHKLLHTEETKEKLLGACMMYCAKFSMEKNGGFEKTKEMLDKREEAVRVMDFKQQ